MHIWLLKNSGYNLIFSFFTKIGLDSYFWHLLYIRSFIVHFKYYLSESKSEFENMEKEFIAELHTVFINWKERMETNSFALKTSESKA